MEQINQKALIHLKEKLKTNDLETISSLSGFRKEKLFQWDKMQKLPSSKIAKALLKL